MWNGAAGETITSLHGFHRVCSLAAFSSSSSFLLRFGFCVLGVSLSREHLNGRNAAYGLHGWLSFRTFTCGLFVYGWRERERAKYTLVMRKGDVEAGLDGTCIIARIRGVERMNTLWVVRSSLCTQYVSACGFDGRKAGLHANCTASDPKTPDADIYEPLRIHHHPSHWSTLPVQLHLPARSLATSHLTTPHPCRVVIRQTSQRPNSGPRLHTSPPLHKWLPTLSPHTIASKPRAPPTPSPWPPRPVYPPRATPAKRSRC
jgi:hypothetical protein